MFFWKPWFVYRPTQLFRRAWRSLFKQPPGSVRRVRLPWNDDIKVDVTKTIGASIWTIGIYEITVSEMLARLIRQGEVVVDAGANVGYMSVLMGRLVGETGRLFSFEPHPQLYQFLQENVEEAQNKKGFAQTKICNVALSEKSGEALLSMPQLFDENEGTAQIVEEENGTGSTGKCLRVTTEALDNILSGLTTSVLKLDVEGHEAAVLRGAAETLREHRIRHIIYEDFAGPESETATLLRGHGYTVLRIGAKISGPILVTGNEQVQELYEPPSFLATCDPDWVKSRCADRGWMVLRSSLGKA